MPSPLVTPPFTSTNLLAWWDFHNDRSAYLSIDSSLNSVAAFSGVQTLCGALDLSGNGFDLYWGAKNRQPLWDALTGIQFNRSALYNDHQILKAIKRVGFLQNLANYYIAAVIKLPTPNPAAARTLLHCSKSSSTNDRSHSQFTSSNNYFQRVVLEPNDQTTTYSPTGTATTRPTQTAFDYIEQKIDPVNLQVVYYKNGSATETITYTGTSGNLGTGDPNWLSVGNNYGALTTASGASGNCMDGYIKELLVFSAIPGGSQQTSIQTYLATRV